MRFDLEYARNVITNEAQAVMSVADAVDESFEKAAQLIFECRGSIILCGLGKSGIIGQKISATLASTGTPSHFLHLAEAVHGDLGRLHKSDVVMVLSHSGETEEISRLISIVKQLEIKLIALTGDANSTLSKHSDVVLWVGKQSEACPLGVSPSASTTSMLALGDALAFTIMKARNFTIEDFIRFHPGGSLGKSLMTVDQSMMFRPDEVLPVAGTLDTIEQLLAKNRAVKPHGAVMIVDDNGILAGIVTDADIRRLMTREGKKALDLMAKDVMTVNCKRIRVDALAAEASAIFNKFRIDDLPVVDSDGRPVGMIDVQDVLAINIFG